MQVLISSSCSLFILLFVLIHWEILILKIETWNRKYFCIYWNYQSLLKNTAQHMFWKDIKKLFWDSHTLYVEIPQKVLFSLVIQNYLSRLKSKLTFKHTWNSLFFVLPSSNFSFSWCFLCNMLKYFLIKN